MINYKNINKLISYAAFSLSLALFAVPAGAGYEKASLRYDVQEARKVDLKYDVYAGGFQALNATLELDLDKKAYDMALQAETQGFIGSLFPWKASYTTSGHTNADGAPVPTLHMARSSWRDDTKLTEMDYDPDGNLLKMTTQQDDETTTDRNVKKTLTSDAVDMLTGTLMMMQNAKNTDKCEGSFPVFDGKRRFNITLQDDGKDTLKKSRYSSFSGEALRCTVKVEPVAGFKDKDKNRGWMAVQNHTEQRHKLPTVWLAPLEKGGPTVPVRMEIASAYGSVVAHLTDTQKK